MAAKDRVKIIEQAKRDYEAAKKKGDKAAMAKAHADADKARGYATETVVSNGKLVQTKMGLTPKNVELAKANAPKPIPYAPKRQENKIPVFGDMFDQKENYVDKFKKGDIGGGIANFVGTGLTGAQSLYLNAFNRIDSLRQGQGIPDTVPMMSYADYEKAVADRAGVKPISEKVSDFNPLLGGAYKMGMEIGTDPLELTPVGFLNDIKVAKGAAAGSDAYNMALQASRLPGVNAATKVGKLPDAVVPDNYKVNAPRIIPKADEVVKPIPQAPKPLPVNDTAKAEGLFVDYYPERRALDVINSNDYRTLVDEIGADPEELITVYRGAPSTQKSINDGDWVTTSEQLAKDYAGDGKVIKQQIKAKHLYAPVDEGAEELIYSSKSGPQAPTSPVQPIKSVPQGNVPPMAETPKNTMVDLGADTNKFNDGQKVSKVKTNTFQNSEVYTAAEKEMLNDKDFMYDVVSEKQSLAQAKQRLETDFDGEVIDLQKKADFDGVDLDTSMGILETYLKEARETGDYSKATEWAEMVQQKGTQGGQLIQSFSKYSRTPEGAIIKARQTVAKVERDLKKSNPKKVEKTEREIKEVAEVIKKVKKESVEPLGDIAENVIKKARQRRTPKSKPGQYPTPTSVEEAVAKLTDTNLGELIGKYTDSTADSLAKKVDVLEPKKPSTKPPLQQAFDDLAKELYQVAKENIPQVKVAKNEVKATDILKAALENRNNYQDVWLRAKFQIQSKYANNPEAMKFFNDFFDKDIIPNLSNRTMDNAIKQTAKEFGADLDNIIKASGKDKKKLANDIQNYILYQTGATVEDSKALAEEILNRYDTILKQKTESKLKQMFPEAFGKELPLKGKTSTSQKVMDLINMGAYDDEAIKNVIRAKNKLPVLDNAEIKTIVENMELSAKQTDPYMKEMYARKAEQIMSDKIPAEFRAKFRALQRLTLILNPKTLLTRNPMGNILLGATENIKDLPAAGIDRLVAMRTGERTTAFAPVDKLKAQAEGFKQGLGEWGKDIKYGVDTSPSRGQFELPSGRVFEGEILNALDMFERRALQLGDRPFYQAAYNSRMVELKKLGKTGDAAEVDARLYALDRVFQNNSELSERAVQIRKTLGIPGDLLMPFTQTPANILDKLIDYSPAGLAKAVYQLGTTAGKGTFDQKKFVDTLARTFTGGGIALFTYALMEKGLLVGSLSDNRDMRESEQLQGKQYYSIKIGDKWYSYDWAQPIAGVMAATADAIKAGADKDDFVEALAEGGTTAIDSVFNQSFLSGILTAFSGYSPASGIGAALLGSTSQITPTAGASLARTVDPVVRETYDPNTFKQQANKLIARVPFVSKTLPEKVNIKGETIMQSQGRGIGARAFENFLAPYKLTEEVDDKVNAELMRLQSQTGDNAVLLNKTPKAFTKDGTNYIFRPEEYIQYQKDVGQEAYKNLEKLLNSDGYRNLNDEEKAERVKKIHKDAETKAKYNYFDKKGLPVTLALPKAQQEKFSQLTGITDKEYFEGYTTQSGFPTDIRKAVALNDLDNPKLYEVFDISKKSVTTAKALAEKGLVDAYDKTYPKLKGIESKPGLTESAQKRKIIKEMNPDLGMLEIALLYRAFNI